MIDYDLPRKRKEVRRYSPEIPIVKKRRKHRSPPPADIPVAIPLSGLTTPPVLPETAEIGIQTDIEEDGILDLLNGRADDVVIAMDKARQLEARCAGLVEEKKKAEEFFMAQLHEVEAEKGEALDLMKRSVAAAEVVKGDLDRVCADNLELRKKVQSARREAEDNLMLLQTAREEMVASETKHKEFALSMHDMMQKCESAVIFHDSLSQLTPFDPSGTIGILSFLKTNYRNPAVQWVFNMFPADPEKVQGL